MSEKETHFSYHDTGFMQTVGNTVPEASVPPVVNVTVTAPKEKIKKPKQVNNPKRANKIATSYQGNPYVPASANSPKGLMKYFRNRNSDAQDKFREKDSKTQEEQTELLRKIEKQRQMGGSGKNSSSFGTKSILGAMGMGAIFKGIKKILNPKKLLGRLSIPALIMSILDSAKEDIQKIADEQDVELDEAGIMTQLQGVTDMVGGFGVKVTNKLLGVLGLAEYKIEEDAVHQATSNLRAKIEEKKNIFIENTGKFGEAVVGAFSVADKGIGQVTTYLQKVSKVALDVFRKKSDMEKEFIKAQDTVRNKNKFGSPSGVSDKEYSQAVKTIKELAPKLLKDKDFSENSIYKEVAENEVNGKNDAKRKLTNKEEVLQKRKSKQQSLSEDLNHLRVLKANENKGGWAGFKADAEIKARNLLAVSFEKDLKDKAVLLEKQNKLVSETEEIVKSLKKIKKDIDGEYRTERIKADTLDTATSKGDAYGTENKKTGKKGGSKAWRNNNPLNITGMSGLKYGAIGIAHSGTGDKGDQKQLIFKSREDGIKAGMELYNRHYSKGAIKNTFKKHQTDMGSFRHKLKDLEKNGIDTNREYRSLSPSEKKKFVKIYSKWEGWKEGTRIVSNHKRTSPTQKATLFKKVNKTATASITKEESVHTKSDTVAPQGISTPSNNTKHSTQVQQTPTNKKIENLLGEIAKNTKYKESKPTIIMSSKATGMELQI